VIWIVVFKVNTLVLIKMGGQPDFSSTNYLLDMRRALGMWLSQFPLTIFLTLEFFLLFMGLKRLLKKDWLATVIFVAIFTTVQTIDSNHLALDVATAIVVYLILALIVYRFGLVPLACAIFTDDMLSSVPFTGDVSAWFFGTTMFALLSVLALAAWGFYHSLGGEPLWKPEP
jgi:hypothetical protein